MRHLGTATGVLNFVRQLSCAVAVAVFSTILLAAAGVSTNSEANWGRDLSLSLPSGLALSKAYEYLFLTAAFCLAMAFYNIMRMEERPLRSSVATAAPAAASAD